MSAGCITRHFAARKTWGARGARSALGDWTMKTAALVAYRAASDVAAKAAFLLADAGPEWLDERALPGRFRSDDGTEVVNESWRRALSPTPAAA